MKSTDITKIYMGDTQGQKLFLGDDLIWPVESHVYITALTLNVATAITDSGVTTVSYSPANAETNIVYSSSDNTVAVIDGQGNITVLDDGQVTICATDTYTNISDCKVVTVTKTDTPPIPPIPTGFGCRALVITYNVTSTTTPTRIMNQNEVNSAHSKVYLSDGYEIVKQTGYTFQDVGLQQLIYVYDEELVPYNSAGSSAGWYGLDNVVDVAVVYGCGSGDLHFYGNTFDFCTNLQSIRFVGTGVELVTIHGPRGCNNLRNVVIPDDGSVSYIAGFGDTPFTNTTNTVITLPEGLTSIYDFLGMPGGLPATAPCNATSIIIPSTVTSLRYRNFMNCSNLESITILATTPPTLEDANYSLGDTGATFPIYVPCAAVNTYKAAYLNYASRITCAPGSETRLAVTYNVTSSTQNTKIIYTGETSYSKIELEDGTEIPVARNYTFPETGLTKVYYTLTGTSIPEMAFYALKNIVGVELPSSGLEVIGTNTFRNCTALTGVVTIPDNTTVGNGVFSGCTALTQVTIANDCNIGDNAFARCSGLTDLTIASGCNIGASAFNRCFGLADITIGSGCDIGTSAFTQCSGLTEVAIPSDTTVGNVAFSQCTGLTGITLPNECEIGEGGFSRCSGLTQVTIPSDSNLGANAFSGCTGLTDVTVQSGATLGYRAFYGVYNIERITIGPGVSYVSGATFNASSYLEEVIIEGTPPLEQPTEMVFRRDSQNTYPIYVADAQVDAWKNWFDLGPGTYSKDIIRHVVPISERTLIPNAYKRQTYCGPYARTMTYVEANYPESGFNENMWVEYEFELRRIPTGTTEVHVFSGDNYRFAEIDTAGNWSVRRGGNSVSITTSPFPDAGSDDVYSARTYSFFKNGDNIEVDGVVVGSVTDTGNSPDSIHPRFFSVNGSDDYATYGADGFLYRAKVGNKDEGSSLIAHYVPAQRRSDNVYGLWDFVTSTFLPVNNGASGN